MNVESFGYALLAAVVGMAIVFLFLVVLSVLMVIIRAIFDDKAAAGAPPDGAADGGASGQAAGETSRAADQTDDGVPRWAVAAALAYLSEEEREYAPRAAGWTVRSIR